MIIDQNLFNELTAEAKASPRLRMNRDLRNCPSDQSQRMLNAINQDPLSLYIGIVFPPRPWWCCEAIYEKLFMILVNA